MVKQDKDIRKLCVKNSFVIGLADNTEQVKRWDGWCNTGEDEGNLFLLTGAVDGLVVYRYAVVDLHKGNAIIDREGPQDVVEKYISGVKIKDVCNIEYVFTGKEGEETRIEKIDDGRYRLVACNRDYLGETSDVFFNGVTEIAKACDPDAFIIPNGEFPYKPLELILTQILLGYEAGDIFEEITYGREVKHYSVRETYSDCDAAYLDRDCKPPHFRHNLN